MTEPFPEYDPQFQTECEALRAFKFSPDTSKRALHKYVLDLLTRFGAGITQDMKDQITRLANLALESDTATLDQLGDLGLMALREVYVRPAWEAWAQERGVANDTND